MMISIAMATYNGEKFIREQLDSIIMQKYCNFELIICDDCSNDLTFEIIREYEKKDSRIHCYKNNENIGFKRNFEKAVSYCKGDYIAFCDQDDIWTNNHLEILIKNIGNASISCGNAELIDEHGCFMGKKLNEVDNFYIFDKDTVYLKHIFDVNPFQGASMIIKKEFIRKYFPCPDNIKFHDAWLALCACFDGGIEYTFDVVTHYRQHGNNITYAAHNIQRQICIGLKIKFLLIGVKSDRFNYLNELNKLVPQNEKLQELTNLLSNIKNKKKYLRNIVWFWNNYTYISTKNDHKRFFHNIIKWLKWREN